MFSVFPFILSILFLFSVLILTLILEFTYFILIVAFTFYLFILNNLLNNRKISLTIFELIIMFIIVLKLTIILINLVSNTFSAQHFSLELYVEPLYATFSGDNSTNTTITQNSTRIINIENGNWS